MRTTNNQKLKIKSRKTWDEYFIEILHATQERATCDRGRAAAIIIKDHHVLTTGYVGSPIGVDHCDEVGHEFIESYEKDKKGKIVLRKHCVRTVHAEQNAIAQAARFGISINGAKIYCTMFPCYVCAKILINVGIKEVIAEYSYQSALPSKRIFHAAGVKFNILYDRPLY